MKFVVYQHRSKENIKIQDLTPIHWAFAEVAEKAIRLDDTVRKYYQRKATKTNFMVARGALAHKMARAAYHVMRDHVPFDRKKLFC